MLTKNIKFENFSKKKNYSFIKKELKKLLGDRLKKDNLLNTLADRYNYSFKKKLIYKLKKFSNIRIIGMGGSILGTEAIYNFLRHKIKKRFYFFNNLSVFFNKINNNKTLNLIVSKSGNTLETISNANILINKSSKNIFITETKNSYLTKLANKLKSEIVEHKNFVGGRYSVLSEVGMLPAELMGLSEKKFKQLNNLIKNKNFLNNLTLNVSTIIDLLNNGKFTSVILNYDDRSESLFRWYQQLVAESLGKKGKGILPMVSTMPRDNHSLMQFYLDGPKKNFFTFFYVFDKQSEKIKSNQLFPSHIYLKNKTISKIIYSQKVATEKIFLKKKKYLLEVLKYLIVTNKLWENYFVFLF